MGRIKISRFTCILMKVIIPRAGSDKLSGV